MIEPTRRHGSRADRRRRDEPPRDGIDRRRSEVPSCVVDWHTEPDGLVVTLQNPLVVSNCFPVRDRLESFIRKFTARHIILDLAGVPYADSVGLGILAEVRAMCIQAGKRLVARNPAPHVRKILEILDLDRQLLVED